MGRATRAAAGALFVLALLGPIPVASPIPGASGQTAGAAVLMRPSDAIVGPTRGSVGSALAFARHYGALRMPDVELFFREVYRLAPLVGIDPGIVVAQSALETDTWRTAYWTDHRNPGGIGITYFGQPSFTWADGTAAARGHLVHLYLYAVGEIPPGHVLEPYKALDPRYAAAVSAGYAGIAPTIAGLTRRWATDPLYDKKIVGRGNDILVRHRIAAVARTSGSTDPWLADDVDAATVWRTTATTAPSAAYALYDLGASKPLGAVRWMFGTGGGAGSLRVQVSTDRVRWTTVAAPSAADGCARTWRGATTSATARYVRFYFAKPSGSALPALGNLAEVQFWPPTAPALDPLSPCPSPATATATPTRTTTAAPSPTAKTSATPTATATATKPATATRTPTRAATATRTPTRAASATATATHTSTAPATATATAPLTAPPTASPTPVPPTATPTIAPPPAPYRIAAAGRTANSTSATALYDRNPATVWVTLASTTPPAVAYAYLDLGAARPIGSIRWLAGPSGVSGTLSVQVSTDRVAWVTLAQPAPGAPGAWQSFAVARTARYVRFHLANTGADPSLGGLAEAEIWP